MRKKQSNAIKHADTQEVGCIKLSVGSNALTTKSCMPLERREDTSRARLDYRLQQCIQYMSEDGGYNANAPQGVETTFFFYVATTSSRVSHSWSAFNGKFSGKFFTGNFSVVLFREVF